MNALQYFGRIAAMLLMGGICPTAVAQGYLLNASRPVIPVLNKVFPGVTLTESLDYSFQASLFMVSARSSSGSANLLAFTHEIRYRLITGWGQKWSINCELYHQLGFQYFLDSLSNIHADENTCKEHLKYAISKNFNLIISLEWKTRLFNGYLFRLNDSSHLIRQRTSAFLTPLTGLFSGGISWNIKGLGDISAGITAGKLTWIRDPIIFDDLMTDVAFGVQRGKRFRMEYGLSLNGNFQKDFFRFCSWRLDLSLFKNYLDPWDAEIKNLIDFKISRFLKVSIQTRMIYETDLSSHLLMENCISAGFYCRY